MFKNMAKKRLILLLVSLSLILAAGVGVTLALIIDQSDDVENVFQPSKVTCAVVEGGKAYENGMVEVEEKKDVTIKNTGDTDAYIRAAIIVTWKDENENVWASTPVLGTDYTMTLGTGWKKSGDYYYYTASVPAVDDPETTADETFTGVLITKAEQKKEGPKGINGEQYYLSIEIVASAIQSDPANAVESAWGVTVAADGTISK